jgi:hypothetical protein
VLHLRDLSRRKTAFEKAADRKRRLAARFLGWAASSRQFPSGLIGAAGEAVVHVSLTRAARFGYHLVRPDGGDVRNLLGHPVEGGPLDGAAFLQRLDANGRPLAPLLVVIEVKNVRHWIYPNAQEIYQLLYKAALLQRRSGDIGIVPILICRRRHYLTYQFSRSLGFIAFETNRQYLLPGQPIASAKLEEVRREPGFRDLTVAADADAEIVRLFEDTVPRFAEIVADRWAEAGAVLVDHYDELRQPLDDRERAAAMEALRDDIDHLGLHIDW